MLHRNGASAYTSSWTSGSYKGDPEIRRSQLSGTVTGTATFSGTNDRGTITTLSVGYLDSGDVLPGKGQGVYWSDGSGKWQTRAAFMLPDAMVVGEGQVALADGEFTWNAKLFELT